MCEGGIGRAAQAWFAIDEATDRARIAEWFGLTFPIDPENDDIAAWLALIDLGICAAMAVREPHYRISREKAERDASLDRQTMHLAPLWRHPIAGEETGSPVLILPVASTERYAEPMSLSCLGDEDFLDSIADLVAIPLDGSRPMSMTGFTTAVGDLRADHKGRLVLHGSGKVWLDVHLALARKIAADTPAHLVERLHVPFPLPVSSLVIEPKALEWRVTRWNCVVPTDAKEIVCPDSRALAEMIDQEMRRKERARPLPSVRGPAAAEGRTA